jgi:hypothetical protein
MNEIEGTAPLGIFGHECGVRCGSAIGCVLPCPRVRYDRGSTWKQNNHVERKCYLHELPTAMRHAAPWRQGRAIGRRGRGFAPADKSGAPPCYFLRTSLRRLAFTRRLYGATALRVAARGLFPVAKAIAEAA